MSGSEGGVSREAGFVLITSGGSVPGWAAGLEGGIAVGADAGDRVLAEALEAAAGAAVVDAALEAPLSLARRVRRLAPHAQVILVAPDGRAEELRRAMLFTPGLGEPWIVEPAGLTRAMVERAGAVARQRRTHARRIERVSHRVSTLEPDTSRTPVLSDQYLATLLELLPEPVLALDEAGGVLFANPAARAVFGLDRGEAPGGRDLTALLGAAEPARLAELLERGRRGVAHGQLALRPGGGEPHSYDVAVAPVAAERPVRALVLHDVTEQVRTREMLEQQALELELQADELQRLLAERDDALAELREAIQHRTRFYASMSHELRTPINAIMGYNHLLLEGIYGRVPPEQREALDRIGRAAQHLLELVNDVLDLSKIEAGKITIEVETVDIAELATDLSATIEPLAQTHGVELRFHFDEECARPVRTDPRRLRQILMNLLSNAVRYGPGAPVDVRCRRTGEGIAIEVEDRGPGIAPEKLEEIFDEFVQLGSAKEGGTGLGLAIARGLAHSLGGRLSATSELGRGSVFTVAVPDLE